MRELTLISHSHWDREWYMSFEEHRFRLVDLLDSVLEKLELDENLYFHLDGQIILLDDYLEIRPQNRERILDLIKKKQLRVGPFYILQDEFLTSGEANVRNLTVGLKVAENYGVEAEKIGYFPDTFGLFAQTPQIVADAGMEYLVFGRGKINNWDRTLVPFVEERKKKLAEGVTVYETVIAPKKIVTFELE